MGWVVRINVGQSKFSPMVKIIVILLWVHDLIDLVLEVRSSFRRVHIEEQVICEKLYQLERRPYKKNMGSLMTIYVYIYR